MQPSDPPPPSDLLPEETGVHHLFRSFRGEVARVTRDFHVRVMAAVGRHDDGRSGGSVAGMLADAAIEALNMLSGAATGRVEEKRGREEE